MGELENTPVEGIGDIQEYNEEETRSVYSIEGINLIENLEIQKLIHEGWDYCESLKEALEIDAPGLDLPITVVENIEGDSVAGLHTRVGFNRSGNPTNVELVDIQISASEINALSNDIGYASVIVFAAIAHEIMHVYQYIHKQHIDLKTGRVNTDGEIAARLYSILSIDTLVKQGRLDPKKADIAKNEIMTEIFSL